MMNRVYIELVPKLFYLKSNAALHSARCCCSYVTSYKKQINNSNSMKSKIFKQNFVVFNNIDNQNLNFLSNPTYKYDQRRHYSDDYVNFNKYYKWLAESTPVEYTQNFIMSIHDFTGLPWWGTIVCTTIALRCMITLPLAIYQALIMAKVENILLLEMPELAKEVKKDVARLALQNNWHERKAQLHYLFILKNKRNNLMIRDNCHPFKGTITLWFQIPMWVCLTVSLRNIASMFPLHDPTVQLQYLQMAVGGCLWIPNLTIPDSTWFMPAILGISNLAIIEIQALRKVGKGTNMHKYVTNIFRCISLALIPISAVVPSGVCLYWTTSSIFGLAQNFFLMSNRVRNTFRIPETPTTMDHPYLQLVEDAKERLMSIRLLFNKERKKES